MLIMFIYLDIDLLYTFSSECQYLSIHTIFISAMFDLGCVVVVYIVFSVFNSYLREHYFSGSISTGLRVSLLGISDTILVFSD